MGSSGCDNGPNLSLWMQQTWHVRIQEEGLGSGFGQRSSSSSPSCYTSSARPLRRSNKCALVQKEHTTRQNWESFGQRSVCEIR